MTTSSSRTITALENLIETGAFASQMQVSTRMFRNGNMAYAETLANEGWAVAERQLTERMRRYHYDAYASCIEPIVRGIVALAKAKDGSLVDITACTTRVYTSIDAQNGPRSKFIAFNTEAPGCGCMQPAGSDTFGPYGDLGLRAVILETGYGYDSFKAELSLVLPAWGTGLSAPKHGDFIIAKLDTTGYSVGDRYSPYVTTDEGVTEEFTDTAVYLKHLLGMKLIGRRVGAFQTGSSINQVIGFPGAEDYLAAKLPDLGNYFVALAEKLSTPHKH